MVSFTIAFVSLCHNVFPYFSGHPVPGIQATDDETCDQKGQCPGMRARVTLVQPVTESDSNQRRHYDGPTDESEHRKAGPDSLVRLASGLELSSFLLAHLADKLRLTVRSTHDAAPGIDGETRFPVWRVPSGMFSPARPAPETPAPPPFVTFQDPFHRWRF